MDELELLKKANYKIKIDQLPIVVYTMHYCGKTFEEIGKLLGVSKQRVHQIYKLIKKELEQTS